jgi:hypothetical protein
MKAPTDATTVFNLQAANEPITTPIFSAGTPPPSLVLHRPRTNEAAFGFYWLDRLRGNDVGLRSSNTNAEATGTNPPWLFNSGQKAQVDAGAFFNNSPIPFVQYSYVRAPSFFDEVCDTGTGTAKTVTHNLGIAPELIIRKKRSASGDNWAVYAAPITASNYLVLNSTGASVGNPNRWNGTTPTASVFSVGTDGDVNDSGATYVSYLFATCPGVSKVGSYTGTGAAQTINCGFVAGSRFVLIKRTDSTGDWYVWDSARGIIPANDPYLLLNSTAAEVTGTDYVDTTAVGFDITSTAPAAINANGGTFIFLAIA